MNTVYNYSECSFSNVEDTKTNANASTITNTYTKTNTNISSNTSTNTNIGNNTNTTINTNPNNYSAVSSSSGYDNYFEGIEKRTDSINITNESYMYWSSLNSAENNPVQNSTAQSSTAQSSTAQSSTAQSNTVQSNTVQSKAKGNYEDINNHKVNIMLNYNNNNIRNNKELAINVKDSIAPNDSHHISSGNSNGNANGCGNDCDSSDAPNCLQLYNNIDMSFIYNKYDKNGLIYCKRIKFHLKDERNNDYVVDYLIVKLNTLKTGSGKQYMRLELSDDKNESFFYYLDLFEENYEKIKKEQKLVINFNLFPFKFIDLLEECVLESEQYEDVDDQRLNAVLVLESKSTPETNNYGTNNDSDKFYPSYGNSGSNYRTDRQAKQDWQTRQDEKRNGHPENATLNLVEINQFKELTHLSLILKRADDENVIKYLCNNMKYIKEYNDEVIKKLNDEIINNSNNNKQIKALENTIGNMKDKMKALKCDFSNTLNNDINNLKEEHQKVIERKEEKFNLEYEELKKDLENFKNKYNELNTLKEEHEKHISTLNSKMKLVKNELDEKNINFFKLIKEKENLENEKKELENFKTTFTIEYNNLKSKYEKECESNISQNSSYESIKMSNTTLETELKKYKDRNSKLEKEINIAIDEINKGNDIITKLQTQLKKMKDKLKTKTIEHVNIEKVSSQNVNEITKLQKELNSLQTKLSEKNSAEQVLRREIDNLQRRNEEIVKELNISREVNLRLNKEITNNNLDVYTAKMNNMGGPPNVLPGTNFRVDTNLLDTDLFTKLKANLKNSSPPNCMPAYAMDNNMNNLNLINGKIDTLDISDRYNKPVKFIPPGI
ncbi:spindle assembly abnormal protein 6 [Plasmodium brasilianum]|uniref:Spindle assembly abnormal protein 6, putative n=2 Tax=Plasmodium (Plasmodium) TaxID=418103 RepID=A0A1A8W6V0_PLAMA|nr:spindle assembly abnormal protein 6, putative [Plasmodium malariae]KAI4837415.1 spindle assembly abnormal protein 6 [Plasmodium brasilianum]SBS87410.1 spindle assembly abnormal protein 6, putative (SAS6) [Plasmodium malariae]SCO93300.1 spindle assembly abnormal protein 6, putative [Plasmodium malariae]